MAIKYTLSSSYRHFAVPDPKKRSIAKFYTLFGVTMTNFKRPIAPRTLKWDHLFFGSAKVWSKLEQT